MDNMDGWYWYGLYGVLWSLKAHSAQDAQVGSVHVYYTGMYKHSSGPNRSVDLEITR